MDILLERFGIFKEHKDVNINNIIGNVFTSESNILEIYNSIRSNNIIYNQENMIHIHNLIKKYINDKLGLVNSVQSCLNTINDINNKIFRFKMLFDYVRNRNRNQNDIYIGFLDDFYTVCLQNPYVMNEYIFEPIVNPNVSEYIRNVAKESFNSLILNLNYPYETKNVNNYLYLYNSYGSKIINEFANMIQVYLKSYQTNSLNDLVSDYILIENNLNFEKQIINKLNDITSNTNNQKYKFKLLLDNIPILQIFEIYHTDIVNNKYFYDIIGDLITNGKTYTSGKTDINEQSLYQYIAKLVQTQETNIIITKNKYANEQLALELFKTFKIWNKMIDSWSDDKTNQIIKTAVNNILDQDNMLVNYIVMSVIIFTKKLNESNGNIFNEMAKSLSKIISISNKESQFTELLFQTIQMNLLKTKINEETLDYLNSLITFINPNDSGYIKINNFINDIENSIVYNNQVADLKVKCNKDIEINMGITNTMLIHQDIWKEVSKLEFKLPDQLLGYFRSYEKFYTMKHNYRTIKWIYEHSICEIEMDNVFITGPVLAISVLLYIQNNNSLSEADLVSKLEIKSIDQISKTIASLTDYGLIVQENQIFKIDKDNLTNITEPINISKLKIAKINKVDTNVKEEYDITNTTDCWIIKTVKPLNGKGLSLTDLTNKVNQSNKYFKVDTKFVNDRLNVLIKKFLIVKKEKLYYYDV